MKDDFLLAGRVALDLLREPEVGTSWNRPSALPEFSVAGLAAHLAYQVIFVPGVLDAPRPVEETVPLLEHYARSAWVGADLDAEVNVGIRENSEKAAGDGRDALVARLEEALDDLAGRDFQGDRPARFPFWGPWSLRLDDLLVTRMMEMVVHADDLAVSVGVPTPEFPPRVIEPVLDLLSRLALRRHGQTAVVRALSRAERSPGVIAAF
ncbi:maleylpyruvate isomerase N-terminal domain-containing protein [Actinomadura gamaensis]|uniref:Maleylpyruvate isomerase N-terminal domain-containing protein n=1 Tax=Actinomadura gamaensis TaxID=1763541 RepID=A0ABV9U7Y6_9ACTN